MAELVLSTTSKHDSSMRMWNLATGVEVGAYRKSSSERNCLCCVSDVYLLSCQNNRPVINMYDYAKDQMVLKASTVEKMTCIAAAPDGVHVVAGSPSGKIFVWQVATGTLMCMGEAHAKAVSCLTFTDDGAYLVSGGEDAAVNVWKFDEMFVDMRGALSQSCSGHTLPITSVVVGCGGVAARMISSSLDRTCKVWDMMSGSLAVSLVFPARVQAVCMDAGETCFFAACGDGNIYENRMVGSTSEEQRVFSGHKQEVLCVATSQDGSVLLSGCADGNIIVWNIETGSQLRLVVAQKGPVTSIMTLREPPPGGRPALEALKRLMGSAEVEAVPLLLSGLGDDDSEDDDGLQGSAWDHPVYEGGNGNASDTVDVLRRENERLKAANRVLYAHLTASK